MHFGNLHALVEQERDRTADMILIRMRQEHRMNFSNACLIEMASDVRAFAGVKNDSAAFVVENGSAAVPNIKHDQKGIWPS